MPGRRWVRVLLGLVCVGLLVFWVWALFFPPTKESVVMVKDTSWSKRAEDICAAANLERDALTFLNRDRIAINLCWTTFGCDARRQFHDHCGR